MIDLNSRLMSNNQYSSTMVKATNLLNLTNVSLEGMSSTMGNIKTLVSNINLDDSDSTISQLESYKKELIDFSDVNSGKQSINVPISNDSNVKLIVPSDSLTSDVDIVKEIDDLINAIKTNNTLAINDSNEKMERGFNQINKSISEVSINLGFINSTDKVNKKETKIIEDSISDIQDVDYAKFAVKLKIEQTAYEAILATINKTDEMIQTALSLIK